MQAMRLWEVVQAPLGQILKIGTSLKAVIFAYALKLPVHHVKSQGRIALLCMPLAKKIKDTSVWSTCTYAAVSRTFGFNLWQNSLFTDIWIVVRSGHCGSEEEKQRKHMISGDKQTMLHRNTAERLFSWYYKKNNAKYKPLSLRFTKLCQRRHCDG